MGINSFLSFLILLALCHNNLAGYQKSFATPFTNGRILKTYNDISSKIAMNTPLVETTPSILNRINNSPNIEANFPQYDFNYKVHDAVTGDIKHHMEKRLGGNTSGYYSVLDADGFKRTVTYTADDENGFKAIVNREPLLHNNAVFDAVNTYHDIASRKQFVSLRATPLADAPIFADTTAVTVHASDAVMLPVYQMPSPVTGVNTIYHHQIFDLPLQQPLVFQFSTENYQQTQQQQQQQQQQQNGGQQPSLDAQDIQMISNNESSTHNYQQSQNQKPQQQQQQLQPYPGDQQFIPSYPQQQQQQQQTQQQELHPHQQYQQHPQQMEIHSDNNDADDDSEIVEARFQTNKTQ